MKKKTACILISVFRSAIIMIEIANFAALPIAANTRSFLAVEFSPFANAWEEVPVSLPPGNAAMGYVEFYPAYGSTLGKDVFIYQLRDSREKVVHKMTESDSYKSAVDFILSREPNFDFAKQNDQMWVACTYQGASHRIVDNHGWYDFLGRCRDKKPYVTVACPPGKNRFSIQMIDSQTGALYVDVDVFQGMITPVRMNFFYIDAGHETGKMYVTEEKRFPMEENGAWLEKKRSEKRPAQEDFRSIEQLSKALFTVSSQINGVRISISGIDLTYSVRVQELLEGIATGLDLTNEDDRAEFLKRIGKGKNEHPELRDIKLTFPASVEEETSSSANETDKLEEIKRESQEVADRNIAEQDKMRKHEIGIEKMKDQDALAKLAAEEKNPRFRAAAVSGLTDQALLSKYALKDEDIGVRQEAIKKVSDQAILIKIALEDKVVLARCAAVERITDQTFLARLAVEDKEWGVYDAACRALRDQALLTAVIMKNGYRPAIDLLENQRDIAQIALSHADPSVREKALDRLTDQALLAKFVQEEKKDWLRINAIMKLLDLSVLEKITLEDQSPDVRKAAKDRLNRIR
jgi:hypothetical protein